MNENVKVWATPGSVIALAASILLAQFAPWSSHALTQQAVQHNGVTFEAMVNSVNELKGAITTLTTTTTTGFQNMTREIQDGQRRDDKHDFEISALKAQVAAHARLIEVLQLKEAKP